MIEQAISFIGREGLSRDYVFPPDLEKHKTQDFLSKLKCLIYGNHSNTTDSVQNKYHSFKIRVLENIKIDSKKPLDGVELQKIDLILADQTFPVVAIATAYHSYASLKSLLNSGASWQNEVFAHRNRYGNRHLNALQIACVCEDEKALGILQDQVLNDVNVMICKIEYELSVSNDHDSLAKLFGLIDTVPGYLMRASENTSGSISERYAQSSKELESIQASLVRRILKLRNDNEKKKEVEPATRDLNEENRLLIAKKLV